MEPSQSRIAQFFSNPKERDTKNPPLLKEDELKTLFRKFIWVITFFTVVLLLIIYHTFTCAPLNSILTFLGIAAGCVAFGCGIGFLFGIPRAQKIKPPDGNTDASSNGYNENTNLEEISDWLTKIILGLTLVELKPILAHVDSAAIKFSAALAGTCCNSCTEDYYVFAYAIIGFYFLAGGGVSYLWTRASLLTILEERRLERFRNYNKELNVRNENLYNKLSEVTKIINKEEEIPLQDGGPVTADADPNAQPPLNQFKEDTMKLYRERKVKNEDDLQLGRWGGLSEKENFRLTARYNPSSGVSGFYGISLIVESIVAEQPLGSQVAFFLHDTFPKEVIFVDVVNNKATLTIRSFEAFAVGARTESGVELELNLNKVKGFPPDFYY
jgi:hypothetical protein